MQCRAITHALRHSFRFVFADAPFFCEAGPGINTVYADYGPFRRWVRWLPEHKGPDRESAVDEIWWQLRDAMDSDDRTGGRGEWVGVFGFSQGAKIAASLLFERQWRDEHGIEEEAEDTRRSRPNWRFAVLCAGRAPLVSLMREMDGHRALVAADEISEGFKSVERGDGSHILKVPTIHVHGLLDKDLALHRRLMEQYCEPETTTLVEWEGEHRLPFKTADVAKVTTAMLEVARKTGVAV